MKFTHDRVEYGVPDKPTVDGWEFKEFRLAKYDEDYFDGYSMSRWISKRPSQMSYWIATKVKPVVEGWVFLDDKPRCPKINEHYYVPQNEVVITANITFKELSYWIATRKPVKPVVEGWVFLDDKPRCPKVDERYYSGISQMVLLADDNFRCNKYWIATKVDAKARKIVRCEIKFMAGGSLYVDEHGIGTTYIDCLSRDSDFIGFEFDDGCVRFKSVAYWDKESGYYIESPLLEEILSGAVEVRHALYGLFFDK